MNDDKCYCMFCVEMRHGIQDEPHYHDYSDDYSMDEPQDDYTPNARSFAPFILTIDQYERLIATYDYQYRNGNIIELSRNDTHVTGKLRTESHDNTETHEYMVLQDITDLDLRGLQNAWFTTSGKILFVPWYGHNMTATILGHTDRYADELESMGWYHYSLGGWRNRSTVKVTDRMYDAIGKFADQNNQDAAVIAFGRK